MGLKYQTVQVFAHKTCQMKFPGEVLGQQTDLSSENSHDPECVAS